MSKFDSALSAVGKKSINKKSEIRNTKEDFIKLTITLPPDLYAQLAEESTRRKLGKEPEATFSAVVRDALAGYLGK